MTTPPPEELTGIVAAIHWRSPDGAFLVARLTDGSMVRGQAIAGPALVAGAQYRFYGRWQLHPEYGRQFAFDAFFLPQPQDSKGILIYLQAQVKGIGPKKALRLWNEFGADAVRVLRLEPDRVVRAGILDRDAANQAAITLHHASAWEGVKLELLSMLAGRGFQLALVMDRAIRLWRGNAPAVIRRNPYSLMTRRVPSCGFKRCDDLYLALGGNHSRLKRQTIWVWHHCRTEHRGNTWLPADRVGQALAAVIGAGARPLEALRAAKRCRLIAVRHDNGVWIADRRNAENEATVARKVKELRIWTPPKKASGKTSPTRYEAEMLMDGL